uniref:ATP-binding cassette domain-containing protein n=1 Tax=Streptomyces niveiscabiei TaxID=164115 RepID=UPI0038F81C17
MALRLSVTDLDAGYGAVKALTGVSLEVRQGETVAILGSNGNGKSTLVKLLAGKLAPFAGRITKADKLSVGYFAQHQVDEL